MADGQQTRKFSLHERFSLARRNTGYPIHIGFIVTYPSSSALPSASFLHERVKTLQEHFPMLWAVVRGGRKVKPRFEGRKEGMWNGADLVRVGDSGQSGADEREGSSILREEIQRMGAEDPVTRPLWQISLFSSSNTEPVSPSSNTYLTLTIDHIISDGAGALRLLQLLLAPGPPSDLPFESLSTIPILEETIDMKPTWSHLVPVVWKALVMPYIPFPAFVKEWLKPLVTWPGRNLSKGPLEPGRNGWDCTLLKLDAKLVAELKKRIKTVLGQMGTLHPVLVMVLTIATWAEHESFAAFKGHKADSSDADGGTLLNPTPVDTFHFKTGTPKKERNPDLGHGVCTGNYTSQLTYHGSIRPETKFWDLVKHLGEELRSPAGLRKSRGGMGMLAYVPDGQIEDVDDDAEGGKDERLATKAPTKWEEYFLSQADPSKPLDYVLDVSNLGYVPLITLPGATDIAWGLPMHPWSPAFFVSAVGHDNGIALMIHWLDGVVAARDEAERVIARAGRIFARLAEESDGEITAGDMARY